MDAPANFFGQLESLGLAAGLDNCVVRYFDCACLADLLWFGLIFHLASKLFNKDESIGHRTAKDSSAKVFTMAKSHLAMSGVICQDTGETSCRVEKLCCVTFAKKSTDYFASLQEFQLVAVV